MPWYIVPSDSEPYTRYLVYVPLTDEEEPSCDCVSFRFAKGRHKTCRHIQGIIRRRLQEKPSASGTENDTERSEGNNTERSEGKEAEGERQDEG